MTRDIGFEVPRELHAGGADGTRGAESSDLPTYDVSSAASVWRAPGRARTGAPELVAHGGSS
jgi:hypothetical protein